MLSKQQIIDCASDEPANIAKFGKGYGNYGCDGGSETRAWTFMKEQGAMAYADYPYSDTTRQTGRAGACQHDESKVVARVETHRVILDNINDMMGMLG
jgi:hypothetical protein